MPEDGADDVVAVQVRLRALHAAVSTVNQQVAEALGVNRTDLQCLDLLSQHGPLTAGQIAQRMRMPSGSITTVLDRLGRAGYAGRQRSGDDQRKVLVSLTVKAREQLADLYAPLVDDSAANLRKYNPEQLRFIGEFLAASADLTAKFVIGRQPDTPKGTPR